MNDFGTILANFDPSDQKQYEALETWTQNYPYFPTAWAYLAKAAQHQKKIDAEKTIERAATLAFDRAVFKDWIEKEIPSKRIIKPIDSEIPIKEKASEKRVVKKEKLEVKKKSTPKKTIASQQELKSFVEWLDHGLADMPKPKETDKKQVNLASEDKDKWEMIDAFIEKNPKISSPNTTSQTIDLSQDQNVMKEELMTETLARILMQQNKYSKALQAYKILSLKYPEKNSFFASQIKEIKRLQQAKE